MGSSKLVMHGRGRTTTQTVQAITRRLVLALGVGLLWPGMAEAQSLNDELSDLAAFANVGKGLQTLSVLGQTPGAEAATLDGDDTEIDSTRFHLSHVFPRWDGQGNALISPYVEATLGRTKARQVEAFGMAADFARIDLNYRSRSFMVGAGASGLINHNLRVTPMVLIGRSSLKIDSRYAGADAAGYYDLYDGLLNRARLRSTFVGAALRVDYRSMVARNVWLSVAPRYNHYVSIDDNVTNRGLRPRGSSGAATVKAQLEMATKIYAGEREVFAGIFGRGTFLFGARSEQFGFQRLGEIGGTIRLDYPVDAGVGVGLYGSIVQGVGVTGHTLGVSVTFARAGFQGAR